MPVRVVPDDETGQIESVEQAAAALKKAKAVTWWSVLPVGYYALPLLHTRQLATHPWYETDPDRIVAFAPMVKTPRGRHLKMGRRFAIKRDGVPRALTPFADSTLGRTRWDWSDVEADLDDIVREADLLRAAYGRYMCMCGCCTKALTDPESILRGIGPECWVKHLSQEWRDRLVVSAQPTEPKPPEHGSTSAVPMVQPDLFSVTP